MCDNDKPRFRFSIGKMTIFHPKIVTCWQPIGDGESCTVEMRFEVEGSDESGWVQCQEYRPVSWPANARCRYERGCEANVSCRCELHRTPLSPAPRPHAASGRSWASPRRLLCSTPLSLRARCHTFSSGATHDIWLVGSARPNGYTGSNAFYKSQTIVGIPPLTPPADDWLAYDSEETAWVDAGAFRAHIRDHSCDLWVAGATTHLDANGCYTFDISCGEAAVRHRCGRRMGGSAGRRAS